MEAGAAGMAAIKTTWCLKKCKPPAVVCGQHIEGSGPRVGYAAFIPADTAFAVKIHCEERISGFLKAGLASKRFPSGM